MTDFLCQRCNQPFAVPQAALDKYPNWTPRVCRQCKPHSSEAAGVQTGPIRQGSRSVQNHSQSTSTPRSSHPTYRNAKTVTQEQDLPVAKVLELYHDGPTTGVFTDGAASPNPGPGGWGVVYVRDNQILGERWGHAPHTTNNRMELEALLAGIQLVPVGESATMYSDSMLCINTFTKWAKNWKARGWKRKEGPIKNLDLVRQIYELLEQRTELTPQWIAAHNGQRWNEYADALATSYRRNEH
jgi:ribonuclease HI